MMNNLKVEKAITNMEAVKVRMVEKLASSTTGAQAHIGLLSQVQNDLNILNDIVLVEAPVAKVAAPTVPEVKETETKVKAEKATKG